MDDEGCFEHQRSKDDLGRTWHIRKPPRAIERCPFCGAKVAAVEDAEADDAEWMSQSDQFDTKTC